MAVKSEVWNLIIRRIEMKRRLYVVMISLLVATVAKPTQANPHYTNFNTFKADMQEGGWSLVTAVFTGATIVNGVTLETGGSLNVSNEGGLRAELQPYQIVRFAFDQEIAVFGFDYAQSGNGFSLVSGAIEMKVFDLSGVEIPLLSGMVPQSNDTASNTGFFGIGDKNSPLKFKAVEFVNIGSEMGTWGIDTLYFATVIPEPATIALLVPGTVALLRRHRKEA
jgi:hypothetical protein